MRTVGFFASSHAIWPPGLYRRILARTLLSMELSASWLSPAASADSLKPPGVTYLQVQMRLVQDPRRCACVLLSVEFRESLLKVNCSKDSVKSSRRHVTAAFRCFARKPCLEKLACTQGLTSATCVAVSC